MRHDGVFVPKKWLGTGFSIFILFLIETTKGLWDMGPGTWDQDAAVTYAYSTEARGLKVCDAFGTFSMVLFYHNKIN